MGDWLGYSVGLYISTKLLLKSDSLLAVGNLLGRSADLSELGGLTAEIDKCSTSFSHVKRVENVHIHLLVRIVLNSVVSLAVSKPELKNW